MGTTNYISSKSMGLAKAALDYRAMRQDMIASNIANADTPNYKPRDINFEEALIAQKAKLNDNTPKLEMAVTNEKHQKPSDSTSAVMPTTFFRDGHMARNDGNSVDLDVETTEMSKNSIMFNGLLGAIKKEAMIFRSVIEASQKVN
jgi:flagellar basal-body rod protein FlgB